MAIEDKYRWYKLCANWVTQDIQKVWKERKDFPIQPEIIRALLQCIHEEKNNKSN